MIIFIKDLFQAQDIVSILIENCITVNVSYSNSYQSWIINLASGNFYLDRLGNIQDFLNKEGIEFYENSDIN